MKNRSSEKFSEKMVTFRTLYCQQYKCEPKRFPARAFWRCLYPHAIPFVAILYVFYPKMFLPDIEAIRSLGDATSYGEIDHVAADLKYSLGFGWLRRDFLKLRVSGKRMSKLGKKVFNIQE